MQWVNWVKKEPCQRRHVYRVRLRLKTLRNHHRSSIRFIPPSIRAYLLYEMDVFTKVRCNYVGELTFSGLKWPPAEVQPLLRSPFSWIWNPWCPLVRPIIFPWITTPCFVCVNVTFPLIWSPAGLFTTAMAFLSLCKDE